MPPIKNSRRASRFKGHSTLGPHGQPPPPPQAQSPPPPQAQSPGSSKSEAGLVLPKHPIQHRLNRPLTLLSTPGRLPGLLQRDYSAKISDFSGDPIPFHLRKDLSRCIYERYSKTLYIDDVPGRYCFRDEGQSPKKGDEYFEVNICDVFDIISKGSDPTTLCVAEYENSWMNLNRKGKADLWRLLNIPEYLLHDLKYTEKAKTWIDRDDDDDVVCVFLGEYGDPDDRYTSFTERLCAGLTPEELTPHGHFDLLKYWASALLNGMGDGEGCTAVFELFQELIRLLPQMNIVAPVEVFHFHKTCASKDDDCDVLGITGSPRFTPSKMESEPAATLMDEESNETIVTPCKQLADIVVVNRDQQSGFAKYLAVIDIHSESEDDQKAQQKFLKEVLSTLQAQDAVFGFLFSARDVMYYFAQREVTGEINVEQFRYPISRPDPKEPQGTIHVGAFQMLILDLLAALLYGLHKFNT